jgi:hypothetical protein
MATPQSLLSHTHRVCALSCWENYVVLERYTLYAQGCEILVAPTQDIGPVWEAHMKSIAREGRVSYYPDCNQILLHDFSKSAGPQIVS